jgi:hypothetical protein
LAVPNENEMNMPQEILDRYRVIRLLGSGGSATVYLAREMVPFKLLNSEIFSFFVSSEHVQRAGFEED